MADALHDIAALIDASKIEVGFAAIAVESGIEIAINGETLFPTASTFKVPLMVEVFAQARAGKFKISDRIAFTEPHRVIGSGIIQALDVGLNPTIRDLMMLMIIVSDNTATDVLFDLVGPGAVTARMRALGLEHIHVPAPCHSLFRLAWNLPLEGPVGYADFKAASKAAPMPFAGRAYERTDTGRRQAIRFATFDSTLALMLALFVNGAILVLAAAVFHKSGRTDVVEIEQAYELLAPALGATLAATLFGIALLASGLNSTVTATLAGQIVMEGFLSLKMNPVTQRLLTRGVAIVPVVVVGMLYGDEGTGRLLVLSQVILSMQLPFAVIPLVQFVSSRKIMGSFVISRSLMALASTIAALIVGLNMKLLADMVLG